MNKSNLTIADLFKTIYVVVAWQKRYQNNNLALLADLCCEIYDSAFLLA